MLKRDTVKPGYKGDSREPKNVPFMSRCPIYTGFIFNLIICTID